MNKYAHKAKEARRLRRFERGCLVKVRFPTREDALAHNSGQAPYECRFCGGWHLTASILKTLRLARSKGRAIITHK